MTMVHSLAHVVPYVFRQFWRTSYFCPCKAFVKLLVLVDQGTEEISKMPKGRGKTVNHKGKHRRFTNPEELEEQKKREENEKKWRESRGEGSSEEEGDDSGDSESEEGSEEEVTKTKGVEGLIQVENPNRVQKKTKKLTALNEIVKDTSKPELSRREREELERQRAQANYQRLHAEGKTEEARADLARLAIIKQQREEAAKRREEEKKQKEAAKQTKTAQMQKALGKKTT